MGTNNNKALQQQSTHILPSFVPPPFPFPLLQKKKLALGIAPRNESQALAYVNFYANLIKQSDAYLNSTLNLLDQLGMTQNTVVVRTADHGEAAMSHDGQARFFFSPS